LTVDDGATYQLNGNNQFSSLNTSGSGTGKVGYRSVAGTLTTGVGNGSGNFAGIIQGSLSISKIGSGTQILSGTNTYANGTSVSGGTLVTGNTSALGTNNVLVTGGTLQIGNGTVNTLTLGSAATLSLSSAVTLKLSALNTSTGAITLGATGTFTFGNDVKLDISGLSLGAGNYLVVDGNAGATAGTIGSWNEATDLVGGDQGDFVYTFNTTGGTNDAILHVAAVPEPGAWVSLFAGCGVILGLCRRRY
jgi:autotransporter-associated beta strand protein